MQTSKTMKIIQNAQIESKIAQKSIQRQISEKLKGILSTFYEQKQNYERKFDQTARALKEEISKKDIKIMELEQQLKQKHKITQLLFKENEAYEQTIMELKQSFNKLKNLDSQNQLILENQNKTIQKQEFITSHFTVSKESAHANLSQNVSKKPLQSIQRIDINEYFNRLKTQKQIKECSHFLIQKPESIVSNTPHQLSNTNNTSQDFDKEVNLFSETVCVNRDQYSQTIWNQKIKYIGSSSGINFMKQNSVNKRISINKYSGFLPTQFPYKKSKIQ